MNAGVQCGIALLLSLALLYVPVPFVDARALASLIILIVAIILFVRGK